MAPETTVNELKGNSIEKKIKELVVKENFNCEEEDVKIQIMDELDITGRQLTYWITNTSQPSLEQMFKIAQILKCNINDLVH